MGNVTSANGKHTGSSGGPPTLTTSLHRDNWEGVTSNRLQIPPAGGPPTLATSLHRDSVLAPSLLFPARRLRVSSAGAGDGPLLIPYLRSWSTPGHLHWQTLRDSSDGFGTAMALAVWVPSLRSPTIDAPHASHKMPGHVGQWRLRVRTNPTWTGTLGTR